MAAGDERTRRITLISGSARTDGHTGALVAYLSGKLGARAQHVDLSTLTVAPFDYARHDDRDDFRSVVTMMLESQDIVFATPVYWYAMSAPLKAFFDRLTDLLLDPVDRTSGRALAGRSVWLLATGADRSMPPGFEVPFKRTARYFRMVWRQSFYVEWTSGTPLPPAGRAEMDKLANLIIAQ